MKRRAGDHRMVEPNLAVSEGWLPETSWQWIRKRETEKVS